MPPFLVGDAAKWRSDLTIPKRPADLRDVSDPSYCDSIARVTLHAESATSSDLDPEFGTDHAQQSPLSLD
jgi:hypothetical protein